VIKLINDTKQFLMVRKLFTSVVKGVLPLWTIRILKKDAYLARHKVNEDWTTPYNAGSLSRWILWNKKTFTEMKYII
jgi:hypothetical protein